MSHYFFSVHTIHKRLTTAYNRVTRNFLYRCSINKNLTFCGPFHKLSQFTHSLYTTWCNI